MAGMLDLSQNIVIRPSSDADVPAMLAIYEHHIARGVEDLGDYEPDPLNGEDLKRRRKTMTRKRPAASDRRSQRYRRRLRLCRVVPQTAGLSLHRQTFDLRPPRSSACRHWPPPAARR